MKQYIIPTAAILMVGSTTLFAAITYFGTYTTGSPLTDGTFYTDDSGNAGTVTILDSTRVDGEYIIGEFETQAAGTVRFMHGVRIVPPTTGNPTRTCWTITGTASGDNMGIIRLSGDDTTLWFNPVSRKLEGYGYSEGLGRVPLGQGTNCGSDGIIDDAEVAAIIAGGGVDAMGNIIATSSAGFIGRVKVIGNAGGTTVFDTFYSQGVKFNSSLFNTTLQRIRKNVGLLTRNLSSVQKNGTELVGDKMFLIDQPTKSTSTISSTMLGDIRSLIVVGGDLYIDKNFLSNQNNPKGIIVLKNDSGMGGNVYIDGSVQRIDATIFTEGTVYSGTPTDLYNDSALEITSLPSSQLYILGSVISRNTIGGASRSATETLCPYNIVCTYDNSLRYDLNYFRAFQASGSLDPNRAYPDATFDEYSLIIKSDLRVLSSPPPGFE